MPAEAQDGESVHSRPAGQAILHHVLPTGFLSDGARILLHVAVEIECGLHTWVLAGALGRGRESSWNIKTARGHHALEEVLLLQGVVVVGKTSRHHLVDNASLRVLEGSVEFGDEFVGGDVRDGVEKRGLILEVAVRGGGGDTDRARCGANRYCLRSALSA